ncbi:MAG: DUF512 domain-containing protein [Clostridia bacterium]|nr:DUF512 domain-containing protein [Clostridia bacterium]
MKKHLIKGIKKGSIAEELEIKPGWYLTAVNDTEIKDILDYKYQMFDEYVVITIEDENGEEWDYEIDKDENEDIGLEFEEELMDTPRNCANRCIFCFMDQNPPQVRDTLVFKDDDFRLSFMTGNYVTLTNSGYRDLDRIIKYHLSPINISVHATNPAVRSMMLNNKNAGKVMEYIKYLTDNGISINAQIVLCPKINDGKILDQTIKELADFYPKLQCIAIVPVGLTKYREGLYPLETYDKKAASKVIDQVEAWQSKFMKKYGSHIVYVSDEFYVLADRDIPPYEYYEDFPQLEDGIGIMAKLRHEFDTKLAKTKAKELNKIVSIAVGKCSYKIIKELAEKLEKKFKGLKINIYTIENTFFGPKITVSGLITGGDLINQLKGKELGDYLILTYSCLKDDEDIFLDDVTLKQVKDALKVKIKVINGTGEDFIDKIIK